MIKEIRYGGLSAQPNEYISEDGESALLMNLVPEKDGLQPMGMGITSGIRIPEGMKVFTHKPEDKTNYIAYGNGAVKWVADKFEEAFDNPIDIFTSTDDVVDIASLGNIIIVSTNQGMHYARWDASTDKYIYLGTQVPKVDMQFALKLDLEGVYSNNDISLVDSTSSTTGDNEWNLIAKTQDQTLRNFESVDNRRVFTSNTLDGVSFPKGYEYKVVVSTNLRKPTVGFDRYITAKIFRSGDNSSFGEGHTIISIPREDFNEVYVQIVTSAENNEVTFSLAIYRGNEYKFDDNGGIMSYMRIENTQENFNHITGQINKFINEKGALNNKFIYPFFVRYATRLYDGSYSYISSPILMTPNSGYAPCVSYGNGEDKLRIYAWVAQLQQKVILPKEVDSWKDLIVGVDIFVSAPIYTYNQGKAWQANVSPYRFKYSNVNAFGIGNAVAFDEYKNLWTKAYTEECANISLKLEGRISDVEVCPYSQEEIKNTVASIGNYYKIKSYTLDELSELTTDFMDMELADGTLQSLQARESLEDIIVKQKFTNAHMITYNNRLIISKGERVLPETDIPSECRGYYQVYFNETIPSLIVDEVNVYIHLKTEQGERIVKSSELVTDTNGYMRILNGIGWFFYPDATAYKATIFFHEKSTNKWLKGEYRLEPHDYLNGAYWAGDSLATDMLAQAQYANEAEVNDWANNETEKTLNNRGAIYISEAENPWTFAIANSKKIGDGSLIGIASATRALSEGQFGQFPLYAFTTEGVWSLSVTSEGLFNPAQPITRDVCISADSITQLDQAVLFATDRGIMLLEGSNASCITDKIESENPMDINALKGGDKVAKMSGIDGNAFNTIPFEDFVKGCSMTYDYMHQRIILYNKEYSYAYVFSLESQAWGMMESNIADSLNSYPDAIVVTKDSQLVNLSKEDEAKAKGLMITRALKLDDGDVLKTINTIVQRGNFNRGDVSTILWGSRDLKNWHLVWSSKDHYMRGFRGTPYKYYRIGALTNLGKDESLIGASINYETKQTNQIR